MCAKQLAAPHAGVDPGDNDSQKGIKSLLA
jgi:hypothetical protein